MLPQKGDELEDTRGIEHPLAQQRLVAAQSLGLSKQEVFYGEIADLASDVCCMLCSYIRCRCCVN